MPLYDEYKALIKNLHQFKERGSRRIRRNFWRETEIEKDWALYWTKCGKQEAMDQRRESEARAYWRERDRCEWTDRPAKPQTHRSTRQIETGLYLAPRYHQYPPERRV